jgi:hypothetical protein
VTIACNRWIGLNNWQFADCWPDPRNYHVTFEVAELRAKLHSSRRVFEVHTIVSFFPSFYLSAYNNLTFTFLIFYITLLYSFVFLSLLYLFIIYYIIIFIIFIILYLLYFIIFIILLYLLCLLYYISPCLILLLNVLPHSFIICFLSIFLIQRASERAVLPNSVAGLKFLQKFRITFVSH